jgi:hypothetical protein
MGSNPQGEEINEALRGIEWVKLVFPDVNMLVPRNRERARKRMVTRSEGKV